MLKTDDGGFLFDAFDKRPQYWFLRTVKSKEHIQVKVMPDQFIPTSTEDKYLAVKPEWSVQCSKEKRTQHELGTVFCTTGIKIGANFYMLPNKEDMHSVTGAKITATKEMLEAYSDYRARVEGRPTDSEMKKEEEESRKRDNLYNKLRKNKDLEPPTVEDGFWIDEELWYYLVRNVFKYKNTLLIGPTGTGKTEIVQILSKKMRRELGIIDMGGMQDPVAGLIGVHRLNDQGFSEFDFADLPRLIQNPSNILLDELSRAPASANNILFPMTDARRYLPAAIATSKVARQIPVHEEVCFIATANLGGEYTGTNQIDRALLDRFIPIELDYIPREQELLMLQTRTGVTEQQASPIVVAAETIRNMYKEQDLSTAVSTRHTLDAAELVKDGFKGLFALEKIFLPLFEEGEKDKVRSVFASR
jgi:MoxR-like ATPase